MPYEYRSLTPEEREEVVRLRRARGHPIHDPPHPHRGEGIYLLTAANFEHAPILSSPERRTEFETKLLEAMTNILANLFGWVILPNHYHILAELPHWQMFLVYCKSYMEALRTRGLYRMA